MNTNLMRLPGFLMIVLGRALLGGCQKARLPVAAAPAEIPFHPRATIAEIMDSILVSQQDPVRAFQSTTPGDKACALGNT